jgi:hypothetical protein
MWRNRFRSVKSKRMGLLAFLFYEGRLRKTHIASIDLKAKASHSMK